MASEIHRKSTPLRDMYTLGIAGVAIALLCAAALAQPSESGGGASVCNCCSGGNGIGCDCHACESAVCDVDPFCCEQDWDEQCDDQAAYYCDCCTDGCPYFTVEAEFQAKCPTALMVEDFSCSSAEPGGSCVDQPPVNSSTDDDCFDACLGEGFELDVTDPYNYVAVGTGFLGAGLPAIGVNKIGEEATFTFSPAVECLGFKVVGELVPGSAYAYCTFQPSGVTARVPGTAEGFFLGVVDPEGIVEVECRSIATLFGDLQFDSGEEVPGLDGRGTVVLIGLLMIGSWPFLRHRRAQAS